MWRRRSGRCVKASFDGAKGNLLFKKREISYLSFSIVQVHSRVILLIKLHPIQGWFGTSMKKKTINLVVVDDHRDVRKSIINILKPAQDIVVVGEAANGAQALGLAHNKNPDVMLLDVELPDLSGITVMRRIHLTLPSLKVLVVSSHGDTQLIRKMREYGASGYLIKDRISSILVAAIRSVVYDGMEWIGSWVRNDKQSGTDQTLTKREMDILKQLLVVRSVDMIAANLGMNKEKVEKYVELLMRKYQVKTLLELKLIARQVFTR